MVEVIKKTLESTQINLGQIIDDASRKQNDIQNRIQTLREEVARFEAEILQRNNEIELLEADYAETTQVKERLQLAENLSAPAEYSYEERSDASFEPPEPPASSDEWEE
jgi:hypothetical protein